MAELTTTEQTCFRKIDLTERNDLLAEKLKNQPPEAETHEVLGCAFPEVDYSSDDDTFDSLDFCESSFIGNSAIDGDVLRKNGEIAPQRDHVIDVESSQDMIIDFTGGEMATIVANFSRSTVPQHETMPNSSDATFVTSSTQLMTSPELSKALLSKPVESPGKSDVSQDISVRSSDNPAMSTMTSPGNHATDNLMLSPNKSAASPKKSPTSPLPAQSTTSPLQSLASTSQSTSSETGIASTAPSCSSPTLSNESIPSVAVVAVVGPTRVACGPKYKLLLEGDMEVCRLNHTRTVVSKVMNSKYLRRWETHHVMLGHSQIWSTTPHGFMESVIPYSSIQDVNVIARWGRWGKFCLRITVSDGSVLLQSSTGYHRDQWLHSIQWKRSMSKYDKLLRNTKRLDVLVKEIKQMIDLSLSIPIQDESIYQFPLDLVSLLLKENVDALNYSGHEQVIAALAPLLERRHPTQQMCDFFSKHCKNSPRSQIVLELFTPVIHRILKHNMDFGRHPRMRAFIQEYIQALNVQNEGLKAVRGFICRLHGQSSYCPHPRILPNLVAVILSTVNSYYEEKKASRLMTSNSLTEKFSSGVDRDQKLITYLTILKDMSEFDDWRPLMGNLLQPIPFPDDALAHDLFTLHVKPFLRNIAEDARCEVHATLLGMRDGKEGWFELYCPGGIACDDDGQLYAVMLKRLVGCCCRRKKFLLSKCKMISPWQLLALRENVAAMETLCSVLEFEVCDNVDQQLQIITTLQSTAVGKKMYTDLYERQIVLRELQQKGGPRKLTLPSRSTDADVAKLLSSGSFGNLEVLSLAFTQVTSACAHDLIKLPSLRYLNLWSTQFGDSGLQLLSEHLHKLQVLNLCETPVTDKGLNCLPAMKNLRKLNLNSTHLSALAFEGLKDKLPSLQEFDIRYTDAW